MNKTEKDLNNQRVLCDAWNQSCQPNVNHCQGDWNMEFTFILTTPQMNFSKFVIFWRIKF